MGNWIRVVRYCPDRTKTFINDLKREVEIVACYLANGIKGANMSKANIIFDDKDRQWVSCLIKTGKSKTKLNHKVIDFDNDMNFSDISFRFKETRVNVSREGSWKRDYKRETRIE